MVAVALCDGVASWALRHGGRRPVGHRAQWAAKRAPWKCNSRVGPFCMQARFLTLRGRYSLRLTGKEKVFCLFCFLSSPGQIIVWVPW